MWWPSPHYDPADEVLAAIAVLSVGAFFAPICFDFVIVLFFAAVAQVVLVIASLLF